MITAYYMKINNPEKVFFPMIADKDKESQA